MGQTAMTIRMDNDLKVQFDALCGEFGMSANTAFTIFARAVVRGRKIPFVIEASKKEEAINFLLLLTFSYLFKSNNNSQVQRKPLHRL